LPVLRERGDVRSVRAQRRAERAVEIRLDLLVDEDAGAREQQRHDAREREREAPADGQADHPPPSSRSR
jgi:hypothetical protein